MNKMYSRKPFDLWTANDSASFTKRLAFFCASQSGRFAETLCNYVSGDRKDLLCNFDITYRYDDSPRDLAYARQTLAFYSKDADITITDTEEAFWASFIESERQCLITNRRLSTLYQSGELFTCASGFFFDLQRKITDILGECPIIGDLDFTFGPGVSVGLNKNNECSPRFKLDCVPTCSESLYSSAKAAVCDTLPLLMQSHGGAMRVVEGRLGSVPKNAKTRRSIIVEPILNGAFQKGVGKIIRKRLMLFGCNLRDQTRNQKLARKGSIDGELATLDLSNASNTMALMLVFHLMSEDWFNLLDQLRTSQVNFKGNSIDLEMFSSMGNGFTFELESLIFYAIALVVADKVSGETGYLINAADVSVYGDDIIIPRRMEREMKLALQLCGFLINKEKSYSVGPFRESCGVDYFLGVNIRPFYKKDRWTNARVVGLLNYDHEHLDLFYELREELIVYCTRNGFTYGPSGLGDTVIMVNDLDTDLPPYKIPCEQTSKQRFKQGTKDGYYLNCIVKVPKKSEAVTLIGSQLIPTYLNNEPIDNEPFKVRNQFKSAILVYDVFNLSGILYYDTQQRKYLPLDDSIKRNLPDDNLAADPYVVRGGYKSKEIKVYMFSGA